MAFAFDSILLFVVVLPLFCVSRFEFPFKMAVSSCSKGITWFGLNLYLSTPRTLSPYCNNSSLRMRAYEWVKKKALGERVENLSLNKKGGLRHAWSHTWDRAVKMTDSRLTRDTPVMWQVVSCLMKTVRYRRNVGLFAWFSSKFPVTYMFSLVNSTGWVKTFTRLKIQVHQDRE